MSESASNQMMADFARRQATPAYQNMLVQRSKLPIASYRETIVNTLEESQILVLSGETGWSVHTQTLSHRS